MRAAFIKKLTEIAAKDKNVYLMTGDLGFSVLEGFKEKFPSRFINAGVAEQNMIGVAAGLALSGKTVFVYSIVPFVTLRCLEQIRNDLCLHNLNVRIVGIGSGFTYGSLGMTHYALEDMAFMRSLVNMTVISPSSAPEAAKAAEAAMKHQGPVYMRLGKGAPDSAVHRAEFKIGEAIVEQEGKDITIISCGDMLQTAAEVSGILGDKKGLSVRLVNMHTIKPIDKKAVIESVKKTKAVFTVEEHFITSGLGSAVAGIIAESGIKTVFRPFGVPEKVITVYADRQRLLERNGLEPGKIAQAIISVI